VAGSLESCQRSRDELRIEEAPAPQPLLELRSSYYP